MVIGGRGGSTISGWELHGLILEAGGEEPLKER
jgi:hypothetical protein